MKCNKCGMELPEGSLTCFQCGATQNQSSDFYNWIAFISYSHGDWDVARYIEKELKQYKLPLTIGVENPELKSIKFNQIFRDENNFGNGTLADQIEFGLHNSKYLISICSPHYASMKEGCVTWCNEEIKRFFNYHNKNRTLLIPLIVDGMPHSDNECFPPSLLDITEGSEEAKDILGIDCTKIRTLLNGEEEKPNLTAEELAIKDEIFDAIKARLLGLNYGAYRKYAHQEKYYKDYIDKNAIPQGLCELRNGDWEKTSHYKFIYREDRLYEVIYENGSGVVIYHSDDLEKDKIIHSVYHYDEKDNLIYIEDKDRYGNVVCIEEFKKNYCLINYFDQEENSKRYSGSFFVSDDNKFNAGLKKSEIRSIQLERDENGYVIKKLFHKYHNENYPVCNNDGFYGIEYVNNSIGLITEMWYLGEDGQHCHSANGISGMKFIRDENGLRSEELYVNENGGLICTKSGYAVCKVKRDTFGNPSENSFYDENRNPVLSHGMYHKFAMKFDAKGNQIEKIYYDLSDKKAMLETGFSVCRGKYDEKGNQVELCYFDCDDKPCIIKNGFATIRSVFDEKGNEIEKTYYNADQKPVLSKENYFRLRKKFDEYGRCIELAYFNVNNELTLKDVGYAIVRRKFDKDGNGTELAYFGTDGEKILFHNYAKGCSKFDKRGNCIETAFYGLNDEPVLNPGGRHKWTAKYDEKGNMIEECSYGVKCEPVMNKKGHFRWQKYYDENGICKLTIYYDIKDNEIKRE